MMRLKKLPKPAATPKQADQEARLVAAETRANLLLEKAEWVHSVISQRDKENHWQASVNQMFLRETT